MAIPTKLELQCRDFGVAKVKFKYTVRFKKNIAYKADKIAMMQYELVKKEVGKLEGVSIKLYGKDGYQVSGIIEKRIFGNVMMFYFMQWGDGARKTMFDLMKDTF